ncbi:MAG TPA: alpha/beta hydrolase [Thermoanaerobaculia bacterium]|jgi:3-oxoadipate enol-lactonase
MPTVELNGTSLFYELAGEGEPLVLLNGILMTTQSWVLQKRALVGRFQLVMHDFRGQMRSAKPPGPYTLQTHVDDLEALLDHLGIERALFAGTSYGGEIAMMFATQHPHRVRKLAVIASVSEVGPELTAKIDTWARAARDATPQEFYDTTVPYNYSPEFRQAQPEILEQARSRIAELPPEFFRAFTELVEAFRHLDVTDDLGKITAPTLVLAAEGDALKPLPYSRLIAERIPNAELRVIPGGHAVVIENAAAVNQALLEFFGS